MGTDYYHRSIFGVRISCSKLFERVKYNRLKRSDKLPLKHKDCPPFDIDPKMVSCPYCRCDLRESGTNYIALLSEVIESPFAEHDTNNFKEWDVSRVGAWDTADDFLNCFYLIGFYLVDGDVWGKGYHEGIKTAINVNEIESNKEKLKTDLEKYGLWDEENFGLWSFTNISC